MLLQFDCFVVDEIGKLLNDNQVFVFVVVDHKYIEKSSQRRFQCDGERRSEFARSLTVCERLTSDPNDVESLSLAEPGESNSHAWPTDGAVYQKKSSYSIESTRIDHSNIVDSKYHFLINSL